MTRLPIRWKVTLAFALTLAVVLSALGAFLYLRFDVELTQTIDRGLRARADEITAGVERSPSLARPEPGALEADESVAQVLDPGGTVVAASAFAGSPLLSAGQLRRALAGDLVAERPGDPRLDEGIRLLAVPRRIGGRRLVVVAGASLDEKQQALSALLVLELVGLTVALALAGAAGYWVSGVALRPVEAMRREAASITGDPDRRLPVPPVDDELGRLGATLNAMLDRLERAQAAERESIAKERRFVADASHELRTPLTILKSEVEVALMAGGTFEDLRAALRSTGEETDRLCRLAEDLLVLAQADEGHLPIRRAPVDLAGLLDRAAARHRNANGGVARTITTDAPAELRVSADGVRLEQALANLVENALRHGSGDVELTAGPSGEGVTISVRDHGAGFPPGFAERAFERFSRAGTGRTGGGAGLGLAIVDAIADAHGGSVRVADAGPGARVELSLPAS